MKSVASHAVRVELKGYRVVVRQRVVGPVECRVEAGNLRKFGEIRQNRPDWRKIVGLVKRSQGDKQFQATDDVSIDQNRPIVLRAAVDNTVANCRSSLSLPSTANT